MSESDVEFFSSQVPNDERGYSDTQSCEYAQDIYGIGEGYNENVISLENGDVANFEVNPDGYWKAQGKKLLYDNILIEDISDEEEMAKM